MVVSSGEPLIRIEDTSKTYIVDSGIVEALHDINLSIRDGEFVAIVGPSGCGKTTLLKILAGLTPVSAGRVLLRNTEIVGPRDDVGVVFQEAVLLPWRSTLENVLLPVELHRKPTKADRERALGLLRTVGLDGFEHRYPYELSGGMQQRASICRSLIHDPSFLLLDEPFGALDALTREQLNVQLNRVWAAAQKTAVLITHNISEAVFMAQRVVVMGPRPGRILNVIDVPFPRIRELNLLGDPEFGALTNNVRAFFARDMSEPTPIVRG